MARCGRSLQTPSRNNEDSGMSGLKDFSTQKPIHRAPWGSINEPLEFELLAPTCAILKADAARSLGSYLANLSALPESLISRFLAIPDTAALAILCRSIGLTRNAFEALALCCAPTLGKVCLAPASALFDALSRPRAKRIVDHWRLCEWRLCEWRLCEWRLCEPAGDGPARFTVLGSRHDA